MSGDILGFRRGGGAPDSALPQKAAPGGLRAGPRAGTLSSGRGGGGPAAGRALEALTALGRLYLTQGFGEQALALLLAAQKRRPQDGETLRLLACAHLMTESPDKALAVLDRLEPMLAEPEDLRAALHLRARALLALGRPREAQALFEERRKL